MANDEKLIYLSFEDVSKAIKEKEDFASKENSIILEVKNWLTRYFNGENPSVDFLFGSENTEFQNLVYDETLKIPYGETRTYKEIGDNIAKITNKKVSYRAIGGALNKNKIVIIIPCHRVVGKTMNLTGYRHGLEIKKSLLKLENEDFKIN